MRRRHRGGGAARADGAVRRRRRCAERRAAPRRRRTAGDHARPRHGRRRRHAPPRRGARVVIGVRGGLREQARPRLADDQAAHGAPGSRLEARVRDADRAHALQAAPARDGPALPRRAAVDDVRRQQAPHAGAPRHQAAAAVQGRLVARGRLARRVSRRRHRRRRLHRQLQGPRLRAQHAQRQGDLAYDRPAAARWRPRPRSSATSSSCTAWTASSACSTGSNGQAALALPRRLADRVVAGRLAAGSTTSAPGTGASTRST